MLQTRFSYLPSSQGVLLSRPLVYTLQDMFANATHCHSRQQQATLPILGLLGKRLAAHALLPSQ